MGLFGIGEHHEAKVALPKEDPSNPPTQHTESPTAKDVYGAVQNGLTQHKESASPNGQSAPEIAPAGDATPVNSAAPENNAPIQSSEHNTGQTETQQEIDPLDPSPRPEGAIDHNPEPARSMISPDTPRDVFGVPIVKATETHEPVTEDKVVTETPANTRPDATSNNVAEDKMISEGPALPKKSEDAVSEITTMKPEQVREIPKEAQELRDRLMDRKKEINEKRDDVSRRKDELRKSFDAENEELDAKIEEYEKLLAETDEMLGKVDDPIIARLVAFGRSEGKESASDSDQDDFEKTHEENKSSQHVTKDSDSHHAQQP